MQASFDVARLWAAALPRFVQLIGHNLGLQHPQYFFDQNDKLTALLDRVVADATTYGVDADCMQAGEILTRLLDESRFFAGLTREQLRQMEPHLRAFVDQVDAVDMLAVGWEEKMRQKTTPIHSQPAPNKKRGRRDDCEEEETVAPVKRHRHSCSVELMEMEPGFDGSFPSVTPWIQNTPTPTFYG